MIDRKCFSLLFPASLSLSIFEREKNASTKCCCIFTMWCTDFLNSVFLCDFSDMLVTLPYGDDIGDYFGPYGQDVVSPSILLLGKYMFYGHEENALHVSEMLYARCQLLILIVHTSNETDHFTSDCLLSTIFYYRL